MLWIFALLSAWALDLSEFEEVTLVPAAEGGILEAEGGWLRTDRGCFEAELDHGAVERIEVPLCEATHGEIAIRCTMGGSIGMSWDVGLVACEWEGPDGLGGGSASGFGTSRSLPVLVELDQDHALWRSVVEIRAEPEQYRREIQPCTRRSLRRLGEEAPEEGERTCDTSTGLRHFVVPVGAGRGVGVATTRASEPVDCRRPCPENAELAAVRAENERLAGVRHARRDALVVGLYASLEACESATGGTVLELAEGECDPEDPPWERTEE